LTAGLPVLVLRRARRQIAEAGAWWRKNRPKAPEAFREELERAFELLVHHPDVGVQIEGTEFMGVRRIHLNRVHYFLYFRRSAQAIEILELWHTSRGSTPRF
jgi:plasmid stabilization system protein ParE